METITESCVSLAEIAGKRGLVLCGSVSIFSGSQLHQAAVQILQGGEDAAVCCDQVEHIDTSALQIILSLKQALRQRGRSLHLVGLPAALGEGLAFSGLGDALKDESQLDELVHAVWVGPRHLLARARRENTPEAHLVTGYF